MHSAPCLQAKASPLHETLTMLTPTLLLLLLQLSRPSPALQQRQLKSVVVAVVAQALRRCRALQLRRVQLQQQERPLLQQLERSLQQG